MPGHIKKSEGPDPDPDPWLVVGDELKIKLKSKPYDPKKSCWVPDKASGGYDEGLIDSTDGEKVTVTILESKVVSFIHVMITSYGFPCLNLKYGRNLMASINFISAKSFQEGSGRPS